MEPALSTLPVLPPWAKIPVALLASVAWMAPPSLTVTLLLLFKVTPAWPAAGFTVQPEATVTSDPLVVCPAVGHWA
jgi:hypothetical protein